MEILLPMALIGMLKTIQRIGKLPQVKHLVLVVPVETKPNEISCTPQIISINILMKDTAKTIKINLNFPERSTTLIISIPRYINIRKMI